MLMDAYWKSLLAAVANSSRPQHRRRYWNTRWIQRISISFLLLHIAAVGVDKHSFAIRTRPHGSKGRTAESEKFTASFCFFSIGKPATAITHDKRTHPRHKT